MDSPIQNDEGNSRQAHESETTGARMGPVLYSDRVSEFLLRTDVRVFGVSGSFVTKM